MNSLVNKVFLYGDGLLGRRAEISPPNIELNWWISLDDDLGRLRYVGECLNSGSLCTEV